MARLQASEVSVGRSAITHQTQALSEETKARMNREQNWGQALLESTAVENSHQGEGGLTKERGEPVRAAREAGSPHRSGASVSRVQELFFSVWVLSARPLGQPIYIYGGPLAQAYLGWVA